MEKYRNLLSYDNRFLYRINLLTEDAWGAVYLLVRPTKLRVITEQLSQLRWMAW